MNTKTVEQGLEAKSIIMPSGCIEWAGYTDKDGYGKININKGSFRVHRVKWEIVNGAIPKGINVCHSCDNPRCFNIEHLWAGTQRENNVDKVSKGRDFQSIKTHCSKGHPFNEINTYRYEKKRQCRVCNRNIVAKRKFRTTEKEVKK